MPGLPHRCPARGCPAQIPQTMLFCRRHWFVVPKDMRDEIWRLYRAEAGSQAHRAACFEAIEFVNERLAVETEGQG